MDAQRECDGIHQVQYKCKPFVVGEPTYRFPTNFALTIRNILQLAEVMSGVVYLHKLGIIHGDLKGVPQNIRSPFFLTNRLSRRISLSTTTVLLGLQTLVS